MRREIDLELVAVYEWIPGVHLVELVHGEYATCTKEGMKLHYRCTDPGCGKIFKDIDGTQEITMEDLIIPARGHRMKEDWSSDEEKHWHKCKSASCTVVEDVAGILMENGQ